MSEYSIPKKQILVFPLFGEKPGTYLSSLHSSVLSMCLFGLCAPLDTKTLCSLVTLSCLISQDCSSLISKAPDFRGLKLWFWPSPKVLNVNWELALSRSSYTFSFVSEFSNSPLLVFWTIGPSWLFFQPSCSFSIPLPPFVLKWWIPPRNHRLDLCRVTEQ